MPTLTEEAVPTDVDELAFLRRLFHAAPATPRAKRNVYGQFAFSDPTRGRVPSRQHVLATLPVADVSHVHIVENRR